MLSAVGLNAYIFFFFFLLLPASLMAMATACFCDLPSCTRVLMFLDTVFLEEPLASGICQG